MLQALGMRAETIEGKSLDEIKDIHKGMVTKVTFDQKAAFSFGKSVTVDPTGSSLQDSLKANDSNEARVIAERKYRDIKKIVNSIAKKVKKKATDEQDEEDKSAEAEEEAPEAEAEAVQPSPKRKRRKKNQA